MNYQGIDVQAVLDALALETRAALENIKRDEDGYREHGARVFVHKCGLVIDVSIQVAREAT